MLSKCREQIQYFDPWVPFLDESIESRNGRKLGSGWVVIRVHLYGIVVEFANDPRARDLREYERVHAALNALNQHLRAADVLVADLERKAIPGTWVGDANTREIPWVQLEGEVREIKELVDSVREFFDRTLHSGGLSIVEPRGGELSLVPNSQERDAPSLTDPVDKQRKRWWQFWK